MPTYSGNDVFPDPFTIADDTAAPTAANINPGIEALGDRTKWLFNRTSGASRVVSASVFHYQSASNTWSTTNATTYTDITFGGTAPFFSLSGTLAGDLIVVGLFAPLYGSNSIPEDTGVDVALLDSQNGAGYSSMNGAGTGFSKRWALQTIGSGNQQNQVPFSIMGWRTIATPGTYTVKAQGSTANTNQSAQLLAEISAVLLQFRANV